METKIMSAEIYRIYSNGYSELVAIYNAGKKHSNEKDTGKFIKIGE